MKSKLTLFIGTLSIFFITTAKPIEPPKLEKPSEPVDLRGSGKPMAIGTIVTLRDSGGVDMTLTLGQRTSKSVAKGEYSTQVEVLEIKDGKVSKIKISDCTGKVNVAGHDFNGRPTKKMRDHPFAGKTYALRVLSGKLIAPAGFDDGNKLYLIKVRDCIKDSDVYPVSPVRAGHQWRLTDKQIMDLIGSGASMPGMKNAGTIRFEGVKNFQNQRCAVLSVKIEGSVKQGGATANIKITGAIIRSLKNHRNLHKSIVKTMNIKDPNRMSMNGVEKEIYDYQIEFPTTKSTEPAKPTNSGQGKPD